MKQSKVDFKGIVLCENFGDKFSELVYKEYGYDWTLISSSEFDDYLRTLAQSPFIVEFISDEGNYLNVMLYIECCFLRETYYEFKFYRDNKTVDFTVYNNSYETIYTHTFEFENGFESLFAFPQIEEKTTSEPEQPVEDAEEPEEEECWSVECSNRTNGKIELTLGTGKNAIKKYYSSYDEMYEDNPEYKESFFNVLSINARLTPLEQIVFEEIENCYERYNEYAELAKVAEYGAEYNGESAEEIVRYGHLANEQIFNSDYLKELISKAGLDETYQAWLAERKEQKAVGASH